MPDEKLRMSVLGSAFAELRYGLSFFGQTVVVTATVLFVYSTLTFTSQLHRHCFFFGNVACNRG